ncbi:PepSY domain-containing protein [Brevundimonas sp. PAMC22021]|uniref:PepSY-associated TM helix domain-containing protein n=1 Tax=Brevundimonas sp. PAMC22021 TaxID=2861285 RepID=UPI001C6331C0|nr:PepSY domain-containing protein [Brevundimonas sp. PAMC22021]QYF87675.1 PepSY domain-containing protein [Brevundimonas sp. PAMC22021]
MAARASHAAAYRLVWRWHFYAGVVVMPFLLLLALTGGLYLFKDEIDQALYRDLIRVPASVQQASPDAWAAAAQAAGGRAGSVIVPARADQAVRVRVDRANGEQRTVFVDPHTARVTGATPVGGVNETIKRLHSLTLFGPVMNVVVEIVAGWAIILCATGFYLWLPRGRPVGAVTITDTDKRRRPFWRDLHAVTGLYVGAVILFLGVTGMPWSAVWGDQVMGMVRESGLGRPPAPVAGAWHRAQGHDRPTGAGWTLDHASMSAPGHGDHVARPSLSMAIGAAKRAGMARPYAVTIPDDSATYTVTRQTRRVEDTRSLYIDARSGGVIADIGYSQFGPVGKAVDWGVAVHQGLQYGQINRLVMLAGCIGVWVLAISGLVMWWKRRPPSLARGRLGAPPPLAGPRARTAAICIVAPLAILFPLTGASLIAALLIDLSIRGLRRFVPSPSRPLP